MQNRPGFIDDISVRLPWPGYAHFLEAILAPDHPEHQAMREWCGEDFGPGRFDLSAVNEGLERLKV